MSEENTEVSIDYVAKASEQGWTPKEDWKGDPDKWVDAPVFVERGDKIAGILKSRLDRQDTQIKSLQESNRQFGEYHKKTLAEQKQKNAERVSELQAKLAQAVTDGDGQEFQRTNHEISKLQEEGQPQPENYQREWDRLSDQWVTDNAWYGEKPKLKRYADGLADELRAQGFDGPAYFAEISKRVREDFPEEFSNPNRDKPNGLESGGQLSTDSKAQSFDNLPPDAKAAFKVFEKYF